MKLIALLFVVGVVSGAPQQQPAKRGFGFSSTESVPFEVLEEHDEFNVVRIPGSQWVCTKRVLDDKADVYKNWREKFDGNARAAMAANKDKAPSSAMFKKLFRYIIGVNSLSAEISMTKPVSNKIHIMEKDQHEHEMCFWLGSPWQDKELPLPIDKDVYIQKRETMEVYVRRFGGWAMSNDDWMSQRAKLIKSLSNHPDADVDGEFYTAGFDSPWAEGERRNEIWIPKKAKKTADEKLETISYKVVEKIGDYELREYPGQKWVCTEMEDIDPTADPMNNWEEEFGNNPYEAMASDKWKEQTSSKMFMKLFKYIAGVNKDFVEIEMTTPVTTVHDPNSPTNEKQEMCFWLGTMYQTKPAPEPMMSDVMIKEKPTTQYYVKTFGGFMMSYNDFHTPYMAFKDQLKREDKQMDASKWIHVSYNSPFTPKNRRNEVWIQKM